MGVLTELWAAWKHRRHRKDDELALEMLPRYEDGLWVVALHRDYPAEHANVWRYIVWTRRQWACIKRGWLDYVRKTDRAMESGWVQITPKGRERLMEARIYSRVNDHDR